MTEEKVCDHVWVDIFVPESITMVCHECGKEEEKIGIGIEGNTITDPGHPYRCDKHGAIPRTVYIWQAWQPISSRFCLYCVIDLLKKHGQPLAEPLLERVGC